MPVKDLAQKRMSDLRRVLKDAQLGGYLTVNALEMRYLCGVDLSEGEAVFLVTPSKAYCFTRTMIAPKMAPAASFMKIVDVDGGMVDGALAFIQDKKIKTVGFAPAKVNFVLGQQLTQAGLVSAGGLVDEMRMVKYEDEIARLKKSCQIASDAFKKVKPLIKTGMTEHAVACLIASQMIAGGADAIPFNIVCFGENTADAHHTPSKTRKLKNNEAVLMDFGCLYEGYSSDMTRSWWHGENEPEEYRAVWALVHQAYRAGAKSLRAGLACKDADAAARRLIEAAGYGKQFFHSLGHGVGLETHDSPLLGPRSVAVLEDGMPVTVEPGIYFAGKWGVRWEDTFLVTADGSQKLTKN